MSEHPDLETLVAFADGALDAQRQAMVAGHVAGCGECRLEVHRFRSLVTAPRGAETGADAEQFQKILSGVRDWRATAEVSGRQGETLNRRVAAALTPYLGPEAAGSVLKSVSANNEDLLARVEPVLAMFLGGAAAAHLVKQIVDSVILEH